MLLIIVIPLAAYGLWVSGRGETKKKDHENDSDHLHVV